MWFVCADVFVHVNMYICFCCDTHTNTIVIRIYKGLAGIAVMLLSMVLNMRFSKIFFRLRQATAMYTDDRVKTISEVLRSMLSVKAFAWETPFSKSVVQSRASEAHHIRLAQLMSAVNNALYTSAPMLATFCTFTVYWDLQKELTLGTVLTIMALYQVLRTSIGKKFTRFIENAPEAHAALGRLQTFLCLDEHSNGAGFRDLTQEDSHIKTHGAHTSDHTHGDSHRKTQDTHTSDHTDKKTVLSMQSATFEWTTVRQRQSMAIEHTNTQKSNRKSRTSAIQAQDEHTHKHSASSVDVNRIQGRTIALQDITLDLAEGELLVIAGEVR